MAFFYCWRFRVLALPLDSSLLVAPPSPLMDGQLYNTERPAHPMCIEDSALSICGSGHCVPHSEEKPTPAEILGSFYNPLNIMRDYFYQEEIK